MGTFQSTELIETFVNYHENIKKCVCLIYDPQRSKRGSLALRAIRLKDSFIELFKEGKLSAKDLVGAGMTHRDVFQEIPIKVRGTGGGHRVLQAAQGGGPGGAGTLAQIARRRARLGHPTAHLGRLAVAPLGQGCTLVQLVGRWG
jgi:hypothetical protein